VINPLVTLGALVVDSETQDENPCVRALAEARQGGDGGGRSPGAGGRGDGVKGFLHDLSDSLDRTLGVEPDGARD
jgi:hypothetical protein